MAEEINLENYLLKNGANLKELAEKVKTVFGNITAVPPLVIDGVSGVGCSGDLGRSYDVILNNLENLRIQGAYGAIEPTVALSISGKAPLNAVISFNLHSSEIMVRNLPLSNQAVLYETIKDYLVRKKKEDKNG